MRRRTFSRMTLRLNPSDGAAGMGSGQRVTPVPLPHGQGEVIHARLAQGGTWAWGGNDGSILGDGGSSGTARPGAS